MTARRTRVAAAAAVAALSITVAAGATSAENLVATTPPAAAPVGAGCAELPAEGDGSPAAMAESRAATAIAGVPQLSMATAAVEAAGLTAALDGEGPFTVFVPNDTAFEKIPQNVIDSILADADLLNSLLLYHIVSGEAVVPADLVAAGSVEPAAGGTLTVTQEGDSMLINGGEATVMCGGIPVANGFVYIIDTVLQPPSEGAGAGSSTSVASSVPTSVASTVPM
jgi:uncharacterized surface protein with fasciclin (FAS1) repeats